MFLMEGFPHLHCDLGLQNTGTLIGDLMKHLNWKLHVNTALYFLAFFSCLKFGLSAHFDMQTDSWVSF